MLVPFSFTSQDDHWIDIEPNSIAEGNRWGPIARVETRDAVDGISASCSIHGDENMSWA
jgi:hypothetical protein